VIYVRKQQHAITKDETKKIKSSDILSCYNAYNDFKTGAKKLKQMMKYNRFK
jgi:hypothetical protein